VTQLRKTRQAKGYHAYRIKIIAKEKRGKSRALHV